MGLSVNDVSKLKGVLNISDIDLAGSAAWYAGTVKNTDKFFVHYFTRDCGAIEGLTDGQCTAVTEDMVPPLGKGNQGLFTAALRSYVRPGTARGPLSSEQLTPWIIQFAQPSAGSPAPRCWLRLSYGPFGAPGIPGTPYLTPDSLEREEEPLEIVRLARVVASGIPHHIPQRGNRRQETCFCAGDYERSGRPRGSEAFTEAVEKQLHRTLRRGKPGPKVTGNSWISHGGRRYESAFMQKTVAPRRRKRCGNALLHLRRPEYH